jgi:hypothetical protein
MGGACSMPGEMRCMSNFIFKTLWGEGLFVDRGVNIRLILT